MKLYIDTRDNQQLVLKLTTKSKTYKLISQPEKAKAEQILSQLEKLLVENNLKKEDITEIECEKRAGSFTGVRVGISIANALSFALQIPVNNLPVGKQENPVY